MAQKKKAGSDIEKLTLEKKKELAKKTLLNDEYLGWKAVIVLDNGHQYPEEKESSAKERAEKLGIKYHKITRAQVTDQKVTKSKTETETETGTETGTEKETGTGTGTGTATPEPKKS